MGKITQVKRVRKKVKVKYVKKYKNCGKFVKKQVLPIKFDFTRDEYEMLKDKLMLNDELSKILEMKIKGFSIVQIGMELGMSDRTVNRRVKELKKKIMRVI